MHRFEKHCLSSSEFLVKLNKCYNFFLLSLSTIVFTGAQLTANPATGGASVGRSRNLSLDLQQYKVSTKADGKEELVTVQKINPGEVIEYQLTCVNGTGQRITNLQPQLPLPVGLSFIPNSTDPDKVVASTDGKSWAAIPLKRKLKLPSGVQKLVAVPYSEYRFLRWAVPELGAGKSVKLTARARITNRS
jgi:uncharacterized repeat protein (TIGR01451 family)